MTENKKDELQKAAEKLTQVYTNGIKELESQRDMLARYVTADRVERGRITRGLFLPVKKMLREYGRDEAIKRLDFVIKNDDCRPRDMSMYDFAAMPDLFSVVGEFSSFDPTLEKMIRHNSSPEEINKYINDIKYGDVWENYAELVVRFCDENPDLRRAAMKSGLKGDTQPWWDFFAKLFNYLITYMAREKKYQNDINVSLNLSVVDAWPQFVTDNMEDGGQSAAGLYFGSVGYHVNGEYKETPWIGINRQHVARFIGNKYDKRRFFSAMCNSFTHEIGHFVDANLPNLGMLGEQKVRACKDNHCSNRFDNPKENSSWLIGEHVEWALNRKRWPR